jgi:TonB family protein
MTTTLAEHASTALLAALAESAIRALLLAMVMGGALALLRVRHTVWRLSAWTIVLWAALAMPALGRVLPTWRVPIANVPALAWLQRTAPNAPPPASDLGPDNSTSAAVRVGAGVPLAVGVPAATQAALDSTSLGTSSAARQPRNFVFVCLGLYLIGMVTLGVRAAMGWMATRRLERAVHPIEDADALARVARISSAAGLRRAPRLAQSDRLHVPVTVSVMRPMVIVPDTWRAWDPAMLDAVLAHEVAHVARRDALTQRVALLHRAIFWFSPLAWWLPHQLIDLAEQASDEAVLSGGASQTQYARVLLAFFRAIPQPGHRADWHVAMARGAAANAEARVERILAWKGGQVMRLTKSVVMSVLLAAAPAVVLVASVRPSPVAADQVNVVPAQPAPAQPQLLPAPVSAVAGTPATDVAPPAVQTPAPPTPDTASVPSAPPAAGPALPQATAPQASGAGTVVQGGFGAGAYRPGSGVSWPTVVREAKPIYTDEARTAGIQGSIELEIVVLPDGTVGPVRVVKSLDARSGLDSEAIRSARQWAFKPAQLGGQPVASVVGLVLEFRLHDRSDPPTSGGAARPRPLADEFATGAYFTMGAGMVAPHTIGQPEAQDKTVAMEVTLRKDGTADSARQVGLVAPKVIQLVVPKYTPDGMRAKIQGQVDVEAVVMPDGTVGKVRVVRSLDATMGLDEAALTAARQSTFTPGTLDGKPVPVLVTMTFQFRLH